MTLAEHTGKFGWPVTAPYSKNCTSCNGSGLLPGSTIGNIIVCNDCHGFGRIMTIPESQDFIWNMMEENEYKEVN